ncbi:UNVERIFIED_CONTAM: hypothetical protein RMT77_014580 [Armadillidium vulgare]
MVTLLSDIHFWTLRDDIIVKDADIGAHRYQEKGSVTKERVYFSQRKKYIESREGVLVLKNSRPTRLRDSLKEFEEILAKEKLVSEGWRGGNTYQTFFASGLICFLRVNALGDLQSIVCDKFLVGKLLSENVTDVTSSSSYLVYSYNDARLTLIHTPKPVPLTSSKIPYKFSSHEPKIVTCENIGPAGRRFERRLSFNLTEKLLLVWWETGEDEVYPWSPLDKDRDRANLLVYSLSGVSLQLLSYCRTELSPLSIAFSQVDENVILTVEQGFDKVGGVTVLSCVYEMDKGSIRRVSVTSIPLEAPLTAHSYNPSETCLLLACNNGVLALHCESRGMTHVTKAGLIPSCIAWLPSGTLLAVVNDRGQMQVFDMALSLMRIQLLLEDSSPQRILDFSEYFCYQPSFRKLKWASESPLKYPSEKETVGSAMPLLSLFFNNGPIACLRIICSGHTSDNTLSKNKPQDPIVEFSPEILVCQYVKNRQWDEAINLLVSLSWETEGSVALQCLFLVVGSLLKFPLTGRRESQIEAALSSFLLSPVRFSPYVEEEFGPPVRALTRRFFFKLLRNGSLEKSYRLAIDLKDRDCYLHVHHVARSRGNGELAGLALASARELGSDSCWSGSCSSTSVGSHSGDEESCSDSKSGSGTSSCSTCGSRSEDEGDGGEEEEESKKDVEMKVEGKEEIEESSAIRGGIPTEMPKKYVHHTIKPSKVPPPPVLPAAASIPSSTASPLHAVAVQASEDGTITINIRQGAKTSSRPTLMPRPAKLSPSLPSVSERPETPTKPNINGFTRTGFYQAQNRPIRPVMSGRLKTVKEVCEASVSSLESMKEEPSLVPSRERESLRRQYEQAIFQELTTEEENGNVVKVVHFGVV